MIDLDIYYSTKISYLIKRYRSITAAHADPFPPDSPRSRRAITSPHHSQPVTSHLF